MGRSDPHIHNFYTRHINPKGTSALLGFTNNNWFDGDLYDFQLNNWKINDQWKLKKKYDTIICTRTAYFAKDPEDFIKRCYDNLNDGASLYVDWGLGDHWRFDDYKIGWIKDGKQEYAYKDDNFLWSSVWDDSFLENEQFKLFCTRAAKFGYKDVKKAIFQEVPKILEINLIKKYFDISYNIKALWDDKPQLYILVSCVKK